MNGPGRIALAHDWIVRMRGGEKCLEILCELSPQAEIFTLVHRAHSVSAAIERHPIRTSALQHLRWAREHHQKFLPLYPLAMRTLRASGIDCLVSISTAVAKAVATPPETLHVCYCNTPMRYLWDQFDDYFGPGKASLPVRGAMRLLRRPLQRWDLRTARFPHHYIGNSRNVSERIRRIYARASEIIYPPVETGRFALSERDDGFFLVVSALVPYKRVDLAVRAATALGEKLVVVGEGGEMERLRGMAGPTVEFTGWRSDPEISEYYAACRALLFPGEEDFGIVPVEAIATGKPVVAYGRGGALETVLTGPSLRTGVLFREQTVESLIRGMLEVREREFDRRKMREFALGFDSSVYKRKMKEFISSRWEEFARERGKK
jgi:glycosyltransferase involved in cell wall biosynthesis